MHNIEGGDKSNIIIGKHIIAKKRWLSIII